MRILGAVLAGGRSTRFGSDKALAIVEGKPLIEHAIDALRPHVEDIVVCGRQWPSVGAVEDRPTGQAGPLAGLNAALRQAAEHGFDTVLSVPIDVYPLPEALRLLPAGQCAVLRMQWVVGSWPTTLGAVLERHLASGARSFRSWIEIADPLEVEDSQLFLGNINFRSDLQLRAQLNERSLPAKRRIDPDD